MHFFLRNYLSLTHAYTHLSLTHTHTQFCAFLLVSVRTVVHKLFWNADHFKYFSAPRSTKYWFLWGMADHLSSSRGPPVVRGADFGNYCVRRKRNLVILACLRKKMILLIRLSLDVQQFLIGICPAPSMETVVRFNLLLS